MVRRTKAERAVVPVDLDAAQAHPDPQADYDAWCKQQDSSWDRLTEQFDTEEQ